MSIAEPLPYRSPISKLLRFFHRSRDQWKAKCQVAKQENKSLKIRLAKMKESRDRWKSKIHGLGQPSQTDTTSPDAKTKKSQHPSSRGRRTGDA
jgi:hypothetical protein